MSHNNGDNKKGQCCNAWWVAFIVQNILDSIFFCCHHCWESYPKPLYLCVTMWYIFVHKLFIHLQISDHFNSNAPNNAVPQDWWLQMPDIKTKHNVKCSLCVDFIIISKELMTPDLTFSRLYNSYNSQRKAKVRSTGTKSPMKQTLITKGDLKWNK